MSLTEVLFAVTLLAAAGCVVYGTSLIFVPAAWILAGLLAAALGWVLLGDVK